MALGRKPIEIVNSGTHQLLSKADAWERVWLNQVADVKNGYAFKSTYFNHKDGMPLIRIRDISNIQTQNLYSGDYEEEYVVNQGDILIGMDGDFNCTRWQGDIGLLNQRVCKIVPTTELYSNKFLYLCIQPYLNAIHEETSSVTVKHLSSRTIQELPLPLPPINEQNRIVEKIEELFSELDKGIESLKAARGQLKVYQQALLKHAFEGKLTEQWRKDNADKLETADQLLTRIQQEREMRYQQQLEKWNKSVKKWEADGKERKKPTKPRQFIEPDLILQKKLDELVTLPIDWKWCKVGYIFDVYVGSTPSRKNPDYWNGDINWVSSGEVAFCHINETDEKITEDGYTNASTQIHPIGTVMLAMIGEGKTRGQAAILNIETAHNQNTAAIRVSETDCNTLLFYYYLLYQYELTRKLGSGNNQKALNKDRVSNMLFPLPPINEQIVIASQIDEKISVIEKIDIEIFENLNRAKALRQSILKKAFSGQLVPQDPTDEPASILLERIKAEKEKLKKIVPKKKKTIRRKNAA